MMKFDYQTKFFISYSIVATISVILSLFKITQLESVLDAAVKQKLDVSSHDHKHFKMASACVWGVGSDNYDMIPEFIAAHLSQGVLDFRFYVNGIDSEGGRMMEIKGNYSNLGIHVFFKKSTLKHHDLWDCLTDNIFNPYVDIVYTSDISSFIFPLKDKYAITRKTYSEMCTSFKQYEFFKSDEINDNYDDSLIGSYRNRTMEYRTSDINIRIYALGGNSDDRVMFLKNYRLNKYTCPMSKTHGIGKMMKDVIPKQKTFIDNRMFELKSSYHIHRF